MASSKPRRPYGTGSLFQTNGQWFGKWRVNSRQIKRKLGPVREPGTRSGLTRAQAEAALRRAMSQTAPAPIVERVDVREAGERLIVHKRMLGLTTSALEAYASHLRVHLIPFYGATPLDRITTADVEAFQAAKLDAGYAPKSVKNYRGTLHSLFEFALRRGWCGTNPVKLAELPRVDDSDPDIRYHDEAELAAILRAVPNDNWGRVERVMYLAAAITGLRQGELIGLRWMDIDWAARRIRVRRAFVRGEYKKPKSRRSVRSVPLADVLGAELDRLFKSSAYQGDEDLVFGHPETGKPLDRSKVLKRYKAAEKRAGVKPVRFHDLRHTFGTHMARAGTPPRTLQEWLGHRDAKTTQIYADYMPSPHEADLVNFAFRGTNPSTNASATQPNSEQLDPLESAKDDAVQ